VGRVVIDGLRSVAMGHYRRSAVFGARRRLGVAPSEAQLQLGAYVMYLNT